MEIATELIPSSTHLPGRGGVAEGRKRGGTERPDSGCLMNIQDKSTAEHADISGLLQVL